MFLVIKIGEEKFEKVTDLLLSKKDLLSLDEQDSKLVLKLWEAYWKKRNGKTNSSSEVLAAAVLWQYSSSNFLWETGIEHWTQKGLAELFNVKAKTIANNSREIRRLLKIKDFDHRYCRKEVAESNPMNEFAMLENGLIVDKDTAMSEGLQFMPLKKDKMDYYFDGMECLDAGNRKKAAYYFKKTIEIDEEFVDACNGMGTVYWWDNLTKAKEWYQKAYELTQKHFNNKWPTEINWGIMENRQYLRAIQYYGLALWREGSNERALEMFKLLIQLNKNDNQGARYLVAALYAEISWKKMEEYKNNNEKEEKLLEEQNKKHNFWKYNEE
ncbi:hypothetical protein HY837_04905 [archaeon]|nr:hypothetical protein [archaeon]